MRRKLGFLDRRRQHRNAGRNLNRYDYRDGRFDHAYFDLLAHRSIASASHKEMCEMYCFNVSAERCNAARSLALSVTFSGLPAP